MTRLVDSLHFGQLFKACSNNYFAHILGNFIEDVKICHFSSEIVLDNFFRDICQLFSGHADGRPDIGNGYRGRSVSES